jgi:hypothetical protein
MVTHRLARTELLRAQAGATLVAVLILVSAGTLLGVSALRSATTEAQLSGTLIAAQDAFWLAELGVAAGMQYAVARPADLPRDAVVDIVIPARPEHGHVETAIHAAGEDTHCPSLAPAEAIRHHYEIHATGYADRGAISTHVQGFYICSEVCTTLGCVVPENPPVRSYWKGITGGLPP